MNILRKTTLILLTTAMLLLPLTTMAQNAAPSLSEVWILAPKAGEQKAFWEGLKKHVKFREESGDPWSWQMYTPTLGDDMKRVAIRACCVKWADVDAYRAWEKENPEVFSHYLEHVAPHVAGDAHYFEEIDWSHSHWGEDDGPFKLFAVTDFKIGAGKAAQFMEARDKMSQIALDQGWDTDDHIWLWSTRIGGEAMQSIVVPYANYAAMDRGGETFFAFLTRVMGSEDKAAELLSAFNESVADRHYQVWEHQPDASMGASD